jgi:hypothetical protein
MVVNRFSDPPHLMTVRKGQEIERDLFSMSAQFFDHNRIRNGRGSELPLVVKWNSGKHGA